MAAQRILGDNRLVRISIYLSFPVDKVSVRVDFLVPLGKQTGTSRSAG